MSDTETLARGEEQESPLQLGTGRRAFLKTSAAALAFSVVACGDDDPDPMGPGPDPDPDPTPSAVDLGTGDVAVLNYALVLERLEAGFWSEVVSNPYADMPAAELQVLTEIRDHEIAHRDFLIAALGPDAIGELEFDLSAVDFTSRAAVLGTGRTFEDLGVAAYNGAGQLLENVDFLLVAGKIVSVEARHASVVRDLLQPGTTHFAGNDVVDENGLDGAMTPQQVLTAADAFIVTELNTSGLPTS
ncbi:MAG TPA: ferritin-like domain-containing protein [Longimicrobiaceae bacterium]|nr:ferritin-like domain-containing protein [Longimicrobiaceae bacterium]